jgi:hypothetical protein
MNLPGASGPKTQRRPAATGRLLDLSSQGSVDVGGNINASWPVQFFARRHRLPPACAAIIASIMFARLAFDLEGETSL